MAGGGGAHIEPPSHSHHCWWKVIQYSINKTLQWIFYTICTIKDKGGPTKLFSAKLYAYLKFVWNCMGKFNNKNNFVWLRMLYAIMHYIRFFCSIWQRSVCAQLQDMLRKRKGIKNVYSNKKYLNENQGTNEMAQWRKLAHFTPAIKIYLKKKIYYKSTLSIYKNSWSGSQVIVLCIATAIISHH